MEDEVATLNGETPLRLIERISTKGDAWNACSSASPPHEVGSKTKFDAPPCPACDFIRRRQALGFVVALPLWLPPVKREIKFLLGIRSGGGTLEAQDQEFAEPSPLNSGFLCTCRSNSNSWAPLILSNLSAMCQTYPTTDDMLAVEKIRRATSGLECVALEKVDGKNFAFETEGKSVKYYSRRK